MTRKATKADPAVKTPVNGLVAQRSGSLADGTRFKAGEPIEVELTAKQRASLERLGVIEKG